MNCCRLHRGQAGLEHSVRILKRVIGISCATVGPERGRTTAWDLHVALFQSWPPEVFGGGGIVVRVTRTENGFMGQLPAWKSPPRVTTHAPNKTLCNNTPLSWQPGGNWGRIVSPASGRWHLWWGWPGCHTRFSENNDSAYS